MATLADGSEARFEFVGVTVLWDGIPRYIETGAVGATPLLGMAMLDSHDVYLGVKDGGRVLIQAGK